MCTVTYLPAKDGFILTSNRDERLLRKPAEAPQIKQIGNTGVMFPKDTEAGGTWIATNGQQRTVCLLNGAFHPHIHKPPYRKSRGLVALDVFEASSVAAFAAQEDLQGIEPFTMVIVEEKKLYEFRWDGTDKFFKNVDERKPHIYCSSTLYTTEVIALRNMWFTDWLLMHPVFTIDDILKFHLFAGEGDDSVKIRMSRAGIVKTVSITSVKRTGEDLEMLYSDLNEIDGEISFGVSALNGNKGQVKLKVPKVEPETSKRDR